MRRLASILLALVLVGGSLPALGQTNDDARARARPLALEAVERLKKNDFAGALDYAQRAEGVFHAPTHLSFVADALLGLGRLAEALAVYERLAAEPLAAGSPPAYQKARDAAKERVRDLIARVPSLQIVVRGAEPAAVTRTLDGRALEHGGGEAVRVDPGKHRVGATAPGKKPAEKAIELPDKGGVVAVELTLEPAPAVDAPAAPPAAGDRSTSSAGGLPPYAPYVAFGVGGAGLAVGAIFGALGLSKMSDLRDRCPNDRCTPAEQADIDSTKTLGTVSTIGFVAGGVGVAAGVVLLVLAPKAKPRAEARANGVAVRF